MENLVGRKVKYIGDSEFMWFGRKESYEIECQDIKHFYLIDDNGVRNAIENNSLRDYFDFIDEPQFKQGDKVLVSNDEVHWNEAKYALFFDNNHFTYSSQCNLIKWKHIKPYEEEIKVGDWVREDGKLIKITESNVVFYDAYNEECTKITNPELIKLLNNEL